MQPHFFCVLSLCFEGCAWCVCGRCFSKVFVCNLHRLCFRIFGVPSLHFHPLFLVVDPVCLFDFFPVARFCNDDMFFPMTF